MRASFVAALAGKDGINWAGAPSAAFEAVTKPHLPLAPRRAEGHAPPNASQGGPPGAG